MPQALQRVIHIPEVAAGTLFLCSPLNAEQVETEKGIILFQPSLDLIKQVHRIPEGTLRMTFPSMA
jgi:hypothetical protein